MRRRTRLLKLRQGTVQIRRNRPEKSLADEGSLFGIRAIESGFFGGVAQPTRCNSIADSHDSALISGPLSPYQDFPSLDVRNSRCQPPPLPLQPRQSSGASTSGNGSGGWADLTSPRLTSPLTRNPFIAGEGMATPPDSPASIREPPKMYQPTGARLRAADIESLKPAESLNEKNPQIGIATSTRAPFPCSKKEVAHDSPPSLLQEEGNSSRESIRQDVPSLTIGSVRRILGRSSVYSTDYVEIDAENQVQSERASPKFTENLLSTSLERTITQKETDDYCFPKVAEHPPRLEMRIEARHSFVNLFSERSHDGIRVSRYQPSMPTTATVPGKSQNPPTRLTIPEVYIPGGAISGNQTTPVSVTTTATSTSVGEYRVPPTPPLRVHRCDNGSFGERTFSGPACGKSSPRSVASKISRSAQATWSEADLKEKRRRIVITPDQPVVTPRILAVGDWGTATFQELSTSLTESRIMAASEPSEKLAEDEASVIELPHSPLSMI
ncbi:hypothetical protein MMC25_001629 [Agyrium rufum]|nr:hypothetical protein [Agyrium rufum]